MTKPAPVAVALDAPDLETAARWAALVTPHVSTVKVGLELYLRFGPQVVATVRGASRVSVFLDLKLHDIPATVAGAARAVCRLRPDVLTVHAAGGADVIRAAVEASPGTADRGGHRPDVADDRDLERIGMTGTVTDAVLRLATLRWRRAPRAWSAAREVAAVAVRGGPGDHAHHARRAAAGLDANDQARVATPQEAIAGRADLLVIGRADHQRGGPAARLRRPSPRRSGGSPSHVIRPDQGRMRDKSHGPGVTWGNVKLTQ